jgi:hypothetical protein
MKTSLAILAAFVLVAAPLTAQAQARPWISDRGYGEGIGIRTGDLELHPGVAAEVGYDSNYFQRSGDEASPGEYPIYSAYRLRITPSFSMSTLGPQRRALDGQAAAAPKLTFRSSVFASYNELFGSASDEANLSDQRNLELGASGSVDILPQSPVGVDFRGDYVRTIQPSNDPATEAAWNRDTVRGGAGATFRPGGGLFDWRLGYDITYNYFERDVFRSLTNSQHSFNTRGRWRFYPRTALVYDAQTVLVRYTFYNAPRNDGQTVQARLGVSGLVTNRFALMAMAGWAASYYAPTAVPVRGNYDGLVGNGELKWYVLPQPTLQPTDATVGLSHIAVGYLRDYANSYLADYYRRDRVYAKASYFVAGRYLLDAQAGYSHISHPPFVRGGNNFQGLTENRADVQLFAEYRLSDSFGINTTLQYDASLDNTVVAEPGATAGNGVWDNLAFSRFGAWLGVRYFL